MSLRKASDEEALGSGGVDPEDDGGDDGSGAPRGSAHERSCTRLPGLERGGAGGDECGIGLDATRAEVQQRATRGHVSEGPSEPDRPAEPCARRRLGNEDQMPPQTGHRAEELAVRRDDRDVVALERREEDERIVRAGVVGHDEKRTAHRRPFAEPGPTGSEVVEHVRRGGGQPARLDAAIEARQRSAERRRDGGEGRSSHRACRSRSAAQPERRHELIGRVARERAFEVSRLGRIRIAELRRPAVRRRQRHLEGQGRPGTQDARTQGRGRARPAARRPGPYVAPLLGREGAARWSTEPTRTGFATRWSEPGTSPRWPCYPRLRTPRRTLSSRRSSATTPRSARRSARSTAWRRRRTRTSRTSPTRKSWMRSTWLCRTRCIARSSSAPPAPGCTSSARSRWR